MVFAEDQLQPVLYRSDLRPCPYLPGRLARSVYFFIFQLSGVQYEGLLAEGWRRSGQVIYRNDCPQCQLCLQMRVDTHNFIASASQRRCLRRNADVHMQISEALDHPPALELYARYQTLWHAAAKAPEPEDTRSFLADTPVETVLTLYQQADHLLGAGWVDVLAEGLSSVYFAFEPTAARRSLGVFSLLTEISLARRLGKRWLWLGYMVPGSPTMQYKRNYGPHELLINGQWVHDPDNAQIEALVAENPGQFSTS